MPHIYLARDEREGLRVEARVAKSLSDNAAALCSVYVVRKPWHYCMVRRVIFSGWHGHTLADWMIRKGAQTALTEASLRAERVFREANGQWSQSGALLLTYRAETSEGKVLLTEEPLVVPEGQLMQVTLAFTCLEYTAVMSFPAGVAAFTADNYIAWMKAGGWSESASWWSTRLKKFTPEYEG